MILDTNVISALAEKDKALTELVKAAPRVAVTIISLGEYAFGTSQSRHRAELAAWLDALLLEALDSIRRQSFADYEVVVVDDASTDGTQTAVLEMLKSGNAQKLKLGRPAADGELLIADGGGKTATRPMADVWQLRTGSSGKSSHAEIGRS